MRLRGRDWFGYVKEGDGGGGASGADGRGGSPPWLDVWRDLQAMSYAENDVQDMVEGHLGVLLL